MAHMVETMAYAGLTPWHGLGVNVEGNLTPLQMLIAADLDWTVSCRQMFTHTGTEIDEGTEIIPVVSHFVLVRDNDDQPLGPVGPRFVPTQNRDAFEFFKRFTSVGDMSMETAGSLRGGKQVWGLAKIKDGFTLAGGDEVQGYMLVAVSHEWGKANEIRFTPIRVVCNNTLTMALRDQRSNGIFKMPHVKAFDQEVIVEAEIALGLASEKMLEYKQNATFLASKSYTKEDVVTYIADLFQPELVKQQEVIENESDVRKIARRQTMVDDFKRIPSSVYQALEEGPGATLKSAKGTWWGAYNAVTFIVDHKWGYNRDAALTNAWFGSRAKLKERALIRATDYAKIA